MEGTTGLDVADDMGDHRHLIRRTDFPLNCPAGQCATAGLSPGKGLEVCVYGDEDRRATLVTVPRPLVAMPYCDGDVIDIGEA